MALMMSKIQYEHREVALRDKPQAMLDVSPKGTVPVMVLPDGRVLDESLDIMAFAGLPVDHDLVVQTDGSFKHHLDRYKYPSRYDETAKRGDVNIEHRAAAVTVLHDIENNLGEHPYLAGETQGALDIAIFPFIRQFAAVEPAWWAAMNALSATQNWLARNLSSDVFLQAMTKYPNWQSGDPALILP